MHTPGNAGSSLHQPAHFRSPDVDAFGGRGWLEQIAWQVFWQLFARLPLACL